MLKQFVLANVKPEDYYEKRFPEWKRQVVSNVRCCFHEDGKPSLAINLHGGGAKCHASTCAVSIGNIVHFESRSKRISEKRAARILYREFIRNTISLKKVAEYKDNLFSDPNYILAIKKQMGLSLKTIRKFSLGLDNESHRITIPIFNRFGMCINIRFYRLPLDRTKRTEAKIYNLSGYGAVELFSWRATEKFRINSELYIMASEKEVMLAAQNGLDGVCSTTGEGTWERDWESLIAGRNVYLVMDRDEGGRIAEKKLITRFATIAKSVSAIRLPFRARPDHKDYADWVLKGKNDGSKIKQYAKKKIRNANSKAIEGPNINLDLFTAEEERSAYPTLPRFASDDIIDLAQIASNVSINNFRIRTQGIVAAKSTSCYTIPWRFEIKIPKKPKTIFSLDMGRDLLWFIRNTDGQILQRLQKLVGHNQAEVKPISFLTATEVEVIPTAVADRDVPYVVQRCYYFGSRIESNVPYYIEAIPTSDIRTQETVGIITKCEPVSKSIDKFDYSINNIADLYFFQPESQLKNDTDAIWDKLVDVANQIATNHSRIYNRLDLHIISLLTWCSPIGFRMGGESDIQRGWINSLALGDTETGKSKVAKTLQRIFNCGVFVNAENCTYVGLVGGAIKMGNGQLMLRWGRIPLSDKQLVVLEELSGLSVDEISNMSDVRSSGVARLDKGGINSETNSRTRILCLSNVRSQRKNLSQYLSGVTAIQELIGHPEDIARFDLITTLTDKEVSVDVINSKRSKFATIANEPVSQDSLKKLVHFIWSLTPDQIIITEKAHEECLAQTKRLSGIYHPSIPVFKGGSGRYKLARIAASIACLQFSYKQDRIEVTEGHVRCAAKLLETIYDKPSFGYREYSKQMYDRENVKDRKLLRAEFREHIPRERIPKVIETLIHSAKFSRDELAAIAGISVFHADRLLGCMVRERALRKGEANMWDITPAGKTFLETLQHHHQRK